MSYDSGLTANTATKEPDFASIFNSLRLETNRAIEISKGTAYLGNSLKPMLQNKNGPDALVKEESGVVGMLWVEINKLRDANNQAELTMNHIREIVGS